MLSTPDQYEIDHRTIKMIVGFIALFLASITSILSEEAITSISASYHQDGWARDFFVGSLFALFAFLLAYNGVTKREMVLSKVAAFAALGVALFPCHCETHDVVLPAAHGLSAAVMFIILAVFCFMFRKRAQQKPYPEARRREVIYMVCASAIISAIVVLALDHLSRDAISTLIPRLTFYGEMVGLVAFGIAWLTASRIFPGLSNPAERFNPLT